jgi:AcrR family transcriptional regulator
VASETPRPSANTSDTSSSTRERLLDAAYELLVEEGYHATTVQHIARRAGLTTGAIYANFSNKHELLVLAVLTRWVAAGRGAWFNPNGGLPEGVDVSEFLVRHVSAPSAPEHRLLTEVTGAALRDRGAEALLREGAEMVASLTRSAVEEAKANGELDPAMPTEAWVAMTVNQFLGSITSKAFDLPQPASEDVSGLLEQITRAWALPPD